MAVGTMVVGTVAGGTAGEMAMAGATADLARGIP